MPVIGLLFFASGFAALVYELLWFRQLGLIFGNTVHAATTVLTAYMLGLAAGAHGASRYAPRLRNPIRAFAFLEAAIGLYALGVPILFSLLQAVYRFGYQSLSQDAAFLTAIRFVLAVLVLAVPTCCMGATLPILCHGLAREAQSFAARLGFLYGVNTAGAVCGTLLCGFALIPRLGLMRTQGVAVAVNLTIGLLGYVLSRRHAAPDGPTCLTPASRIRNRCHGRRRAHNPGRALGDGTEGEITAAPPHRLGHLGPRGGETLSEPGEGVGSLERTVLAGIFQRHAGGIRRAAEGRLRRAARESPGAEGRRAGSGAARKSRRRSAPRWRRGPGICS
jgi:hypothetical protein